MNKEQQRKLTSLNLELVEINSLISLLTYEISLLPAWNIYRYISCRNEMRRLKRNFYAVETEGKMLLANWLRETQEENQIRDDIEEIFKGIEL